MDEINEDDFNFYFQQNRKIELITIDQVKKPEKIDSKNLIHVVVIIARINPGESPASFVCQGFLEYLTIANHPISRTLREHVVFKIIPMLNPDGVFLGNNRCNLIGHDLNRSWDHISSYTHPTLQAAFNILKELDTSSVIHTYIFHLLFKFSICNYGFILVLSN